MLREVNKTIFAPPFLYSLNFSIISGYGTKSIYSCSFFLIGHNDDETIFEYTINGNINDAHNLSKKVKGPAKRAIKVLTIVEFAIFSLIALGCVFSQFKIINIKGACQIFGLALWTRGVIEIFRAYYYRADSKEVYPVWYLGLSIVMVTLGAYCFAKPFIQDIVILWIFVISLLLAGSLLLVLGITQIRNKKKKVTSK